MSLFSVNVSIYRDSKIILLSVAIAFLQFTLFTVPRDLINFLKQVDILLIVTFLLAIFVFE